MKNVSEWNTFMKTGRVEDYLRYTNAVSDTLSDKNPQRQPDEKKGMEQTHAESDYRFRNHY